MAAHSPCGPCMSGDHERHDGTHQGLPGLIGGSICMCQGDCAERAAEAVERLFGPVRELFAGKRGEVS